ncbi:hypothetical protein BSK59_13930 [Paenibacillus odorifer]|uniref:hypothetical protein n=1 Tax=Paenibacillus odorifer TaxID=189426 RepID=UPI00096CF32B|nr:hypothetical protein [Paenibacillus odorifer]OME55569.1 hypothetical protein BSK59_13930 [Paenibacillus odorifer]
MKTNIFVPQKIKVGFQNRENTYTKKLAFVIYYDAKGKLRQETSWEGWRDEKIDPVEYENEPVSGFVLNKKVGDYKDGWNHRQAYTRVYDPRGFEFEITIENLLYILENTNSIKGKGLEGEFVYSWDGKNLILLPVDSPDYQEISQFNKVLHEKTYIKSKELIIGATYRTKDNQELVYMGRFDYWDTKWNSGNDYKDSYYENVNKGKQYIFAKEIINYRKKQDIHILNLKSIGDRIIEMISIDCCERYAEMFDLLESRSCYSPYDESKDEYVYYDLSRFIEKVKKKIGKYAWHYSTTVYIGNEKSSYAEVKGVRDSESYQIVVKRKVPSRWGSGYTTEDVTLLTGTLEEIHEAYKPRYRNEYLTNGKLYKMGDEE